MCVEIRDMIFAHFEPVASALPDLSNDMKRMLKVQWKEFLHWLDENSRDCYLDESEMRLRQQLEPAIFCARDAAWQCDVRRC